MRAASKRDQVRPCARCAAHSRSLPTAQLLLALCARSCLQSISCSKDKLHCSLLTKITLRVSQLLITPRQQCHCN